MSSTISNMGAELTTYMKWSFRDPEDAPDLNAVANGVQLEHQLLFRKMGYTGHLDFEYTILPEDPALGLFESVRFTSTVAP